MDPELSVSLEFIFLLGGSNKRSTGLYTNDEYVLHTCFDKHNLQQEAWKYQDQGRARSSWK